MYNYKKKYLKYKTKYLTSKLPQSGGGDSFKINGPVSSHILKNKELDRLIYLFGDEHTIRGKFCQAACSLEQDCYNIVEFFDQVIYRNIQRNLKIKDDDKKEYVDIFLETPYVTKEAKEVVEKFRQNVRKFFREYIKSLDLEKGIGKYEKETIMGAFERRELVGPMQQLFYSYDRCIRETKCMNYIRLHNIDYRDSTGITEDLNILSIIDDILNIHRKLFEFPDKLALSRKTLEKLFLRENKDASPFNIFRVIDKYYELFEIKEKGSEHVYIENLYKLFDRMYEKIGSKIKRQFEYTTSKLDFDSIKRNILGDIYCEYKRAVHHIDKLSKSQDIFKKYIDATSENEFYDKIVDYGMMDVKHFLALYGLIYMDLYIMGRIFREFRDGTYPKNIMVFAGDAHIDNYVKFIKNMEGTTVLHSKSGRFELNKCADIPFDKYKMMDFEL
uniref:Uncharacterized protein n=1 Tax=Mimivirus LCMiAC02 TaxID=2506609 RepID=A0A481Z1G8_9VIRU|nr:MAG: hypothetical protein LCMiAC02_00300 [Mimivirus LCMiAC02]